MEFAPSDSSHVQPLGDRDWNCWPGLTGVEPHAGRLPWGRLDLPRADAHALADTKPRFRGLDCLAPTTTYTVLAMEELLGKDPGALASAPAPLPQPVLRLVLTFSIQLIGCLSVAGGRLEPTT